jgi:hypothetical protein
MAIAKHPKAKHAIAHWQNQLGAFFLYPAKGAVIAAVLVLTLCTVIGSFLSVLGLIISALVMISAYTFAFEILQHHANGWDEPPESALKVSSALVYQYLIAMFIAAVMIGVVYQLLGPAAGIGLLVLFCLIQPAFTIVSVIEGGVIPALNPAKWVRLMGVLGNGYFLLATLLFVGQLLQSWIGTSAISFLPGFITVGITKFLGLWILFSSAYWMGYMIYQYHHKLGFEPDAHHEQAIRGNDRDGVLIQEIEAAIQENTFDDCIQKVNYAQRERVLTAAAHAKFRELLIKKGDRLAIREHAQLFLHQLITEKNLPRATSLAIQQYSIDPDFVPLDWEASNTLLQETLRIGNTGLEKKLLNSLIRQFYKEDHVLTWIPRLVALLKQDGESAHSIATFLDTTLSNTKPESQRERLMAARRLIA